MNSALLRLVVFISLASLSLQADPDDGVAELSQGIAGLSISQRSSQVPSLMNLAAKAVAPLLIWECKQKDGYEKTLTLVDEWFSGASHLKKLVRDHIVADCGFDEFVLKNQEIFSDEIRGSRCCAQFLPDGSGAYFAFSRNIYKLTFADSKLEPLLPYDDVAIKTFALSPNTNSLAISFVDGNRHAGLSVLDLEKDALIYHQKSQAMVNSIDFSPNGDRIAFGVSERVNCVLGLQELVSVTIHFGETVDFVTFTPDGNSLIVGGGRVVKQYDGLDGNNPTETILLNLAESSETAFSTCYALSPDGRSLALGYKNGGGYIALRDNKTGGCNLSFSSLINSLMSISFSMDSKLLAACDSHGAVAVVDVSTSKVLILGDFYDVRQVLFSPVDNTLLVVHKQNQDEYRSDWAITFLVPATLETLLQQIAENSEHVASSAPVGHASAYDAPVLG